MAKNLRGFSGKKSNAVDKETIEEVKKNISNDDLSGVKQITDKYKNKSSNEMLNDIMKMISQGKRNGNLSDYELKAFAENVMPMLSPEQANKLNRLIDSTK